MPECAPVSTHMGQEGLRGASSGAKTGLEEPHGPRLPETCLAQDANRALCSPSLDVVSHDIVYRGWGERDEGLARYGSRY